MRTKRRRGGVGWRNRRRKEEEKVFMFISG